MQSMLKEDDDMTSLLSLGVKLVPLLLTRVEESLKKTIGKLDLTKFLLNTATLCIFVRDCMWASPNAQIRRDVHQRFAEQLLLKRRTC